MVTVGGSGVAVGSGVGVGGTGVAVGGTGVAVGGIGVAVGGIGVAVGSGVGVAVGGIGVAVGSGVGVAVGGIGVAVGSGVGVAVGVSLGKNKRNSPPCPAMKMLEVSASRVLFRFSGSPLSTKKNWIVEPSWLVSVVVIAILYSPSKTVTFLVRIVSPITANT